jgi:hypothetical protein
MFQCWRKQASRHPTLQFHPYFKEKRTMGLRGIVIPLVAAMLSATVVVAQASNVIDSCNSYCRNTCGGSEPLCRQAEGMSSDKKCRLAANVTCSAGQGPIKLYDGTDLDMAGFSIECAANIDCGHGVQMELGSSRLYNSAPDTESIIKGRFFSGVYCKAMPFSSVRGITFEDSIFGIDDCQVAQHNVIRKTGRLFMNVNQGIRLSGASVNNALITDNYIQDRNYGISRYFASGYGNDRIERNVIHTTDRGNCGIYVQAFSAPTARDNVILGTGTSSGTPKVICLESDLWGTFSGNVCDKDHPDCSACRATDVGDGFLCTKTTSPYPDSTAIQTDGQISLKNLGSAGGSDTSIGWNGSGHHAEAPIGTEATLNLLNCVVGSTTTTCDIFAASSGQVSSVTVSPDPNSSTHYLTSWNVFAEDVSGSITYEGGLPVPIGALDIVEMNLKARQSALVHYGTAHPTCTGASLGDTGVCQDGSLRDGLPCVVQWETSFGNTSADCLPGISFGFALPEVTVTTGTVSLPASINCSGDLCHCSGQTEPNACSDGQCASNGTCATNSSLSCFPDDLSVSGSTSPLKLVGLACQHSVSQLNDVVGFPGPIAVTQALEVEGLP